MNAQYHPCKFKASILFLLLFSLSTVLAQNGNSVQIYGSPHGIVAPTTTELIRVEGEIDYQGPTDKPVRGIAFEGLTFSHADRWAWKSDEGRLGWGMQHDWDMFDRPTALVRFRGSEECQVTNCRFINSGGSGVRLDLHAQRNRIENSEFTHLGEAGILLAGYGPGTKDVNHHNDIINNHIHQFSEITWHSPGIWTGIQAGYTSNKSPGLALRSGKWKFLMNPDGSRQELYDFEADPQCMELDNLADRYPEEVKRFSKMLREFKASIPQGVPQEGSGSNVYPMPANN